MKYVQVACLMLLLYLSYNTMCSTSFEDQLKERGYENCIVVKGVLLCYKNDTTVNINQ